MNCIIVDDEYPSIQELSYFITNFSSITISETFDDSIKALEYIQRHSVNVIFLDINMPKLDGLTFSKVINTLPVKPVLVFITAYREHALEAFEVSAFDYILKPYSQTRIADTLQRLENSTAVRLHNDKITLWKNEKLYVLDADDIYYCEAHKHEVYVYTKDKRFVVASSISDFHKKLRQDCFFRCHRSYIVNIDKITEIIPWFNNTYMLKLKGLDAEIPVSRQNILLFKKLMGI
ncbi:MAG TPA: LytTR family DNA-binding domain-containing protein [Bacillota bacterium]|nr:LytTR family DNA-binding domain-containing protein [Clostridiaceae bacterium]HNT02918.1 LytTR family DNA-binding domain-containing protein [Bacillota bacterium]HPX69520.1 LytTR family DNA-binding domain-containing protein [Bacillota bacterium]HQA65307.1 LytTR family DNA-binding domain-containing protein [Bacillota bacterium]